MPAGALRVRDEDEFLAAIRARVAELEITQLTLDAIAGLPTGFSGKLLCNPPMRHVSPMVLWVLLGAVGFDLCLVHSPEALAKVKGLLSTKRKIPNNRHISPMTLARRRNSPWLFDPERGRAMASVRLAKISPARRVQIAKKAARHRWK